MSTQPLDLDMLATHLRSRMEERGLSLRATAEEVGCSPATMRRLLLGSASPNMPETANIIRAVSWLGRSLADFLVGSPAKPSSIADVEVHLRALPNLTQADTEALVAMVRAAYDSAVHARQKTS